MLGVLLCSGNGELSATAKSNKRGIHCRDGESAAGSVVSRVVLLAAASIASLRYWLQYVLSLKPTRREVLTMQAPRLTARYKHFSDSAKST